MDKPTFELLCIGAGGTGGYFLKEFSRYYFKKLPIKSLNVMDGDIVEEHNLTRQCFLSEDIGQKKAAVLAEILNSSFNLSWNCFPRFLTSLKDFDDVFTYASSSIPIIIGCVDNHGCRLLCEEYFNTHDNCIYFDAANEIESGEVVFSYKIKGQQLSLLRSEIFPELRNGNADTRNVTELSCEELNVHMPQHIITNMLAGNILLSAVCKLLENGEFHLGMTVFNAASMTMEFIERRKEKHD